MAQYQLHSLVTNVIGVGGEVDGGLGLEGVLLKKYVHRERLCRGSLKGIRGR